MQRSKYMIGRYPIFTGGVIGLLLCMNVSHGQETDYCIECHTVVNEEITSAFESDVHATAGLGCDDCHGGNPSIDDDAAMDPGIGFVGSPSRFDEPEFCGKCHSDPSYLHTFNPRLPTDQVEKYRTSNHGQLLADGDKKVAICSSCHNSHGILSPSAPTSMIYPTNVPSTCANCHSNEAYMSEYDIPTNQFAQYSDSSNVHGYALLVKRDIGAPACNDCHGNHGTAPPGIDHVAQVCTHCHANNGELFRSSPHLEAFEMLELSQCAFCHQASPSLDDPLANLHTIVAPDHNLIGTDESALCGQCHSEGDAGWETATIISTLRDSLEAKLEKAQTLLEEVEVRGFEISDAKYILDSEVRQDKMELRTMIHAFDLEVYKPVFAKTDTALHGVILAGMLAEKEVGGRRTYLLTITLLIGLVVVALVMKIKDIERE